MQQLLFPKEVQKWIGPQVNYVDTHGVQWIELNRGCKRQCPFCHADPNYVEYSLPVLHSNRVQIIGEGFCFDSRLQTILSSLAEMRYDGKVIYFGLSQGADYRLMTPELWSMMAKARVGIINNKGKWYKGMRIAWDWGKEQEEAVKQTIETLVTLGYSRSMISIFMLTNWEINYTTCLYKAVRCMEWGVKVDDCTWETSKKHWTEQHWDRLQHRNFRLVVRDHNIRVTRGFNPYA